MFSALTTFFGLFVKAGVVLLILNEVRGLVMAAPVLYALYVSGGSAMAMVIAASSLTGVAISVILPIIFYRQLRRSRLAV